MLVPCNWRNVAVFDPSAGVSDAFESEFTMDDPAIFQTFRVHISRYVAGDIQVDLFFGFNQADTRASLQFIAFPVLGALDLSDIRSFIWVLVGGAPNAAGNPNSILPPHVEVRVTTAIGTDLTVEIQAAWIAIK